jgi:hypothetical protein
MSVGASRCGLDPDALSHSWRVFRSAPTPVNVPRIGPWGQYDCGPALSDGLALTSAGAPDNVQSIRGANCDELVSRKVSVDPSVVDRIERIGPNNSQPLYLQD